MKKILLFCLLVFLSFESISASSLKGGFPSCVTKELYEEFMNSYMRHDEKNCEYLLKKNFCFFLPAGLKIAILEQSAWKGHAKIRVFLKKDAVIMWTHLKNINRGDNLSGN